jgi:hypothetical protein
MIWALEYLDVDCIDLARGSDQWWLRINTDMNASGPKEGKSLPC